MIFIKRNAKKKKENKSYVKSSYYRYIFNTSFNIDFRISKADRFEKCEGIKIKKNENIPILNEEKHLYDLHTEVPENFAMQEEKKKDKLIKDESYLLVVFYLENVIILPKADAGSFFYKRKLTLYNLTAMVSKKQGYCAIWIECMSGRAGNEIASAFVQILKTVVLDDQMCLNLFLGLTVVCLKKGILTSPKLFLNF